MRACHNCLHWDVCNVREDDIACGIYKPKEKRNVKPQTNADCIRAMSDDEMKEFICSTLQCKFCKFEGFGGCELLEWLQQPAEGE